MFQTIPQASNKLFKHFLVIWLGELISSIGSGLTAFALSVYVFNLTHSATTVSLITLCAFLPTILLSPFSGVLADRFDRRLLMIIGDSFSALGIVYILFSIHTGSVQIWQIYIGIIFSSIFCSLMEPAYKATVTDLLCENDYAKASGLIQLAASSKYLVSPLIAGLLLTIVSIKVILIIDITTFFITVFVIWYVKTNTNSKNAKQKALNFINDFSEGWSSVINNKGVFNLTLLLAIITFYMGLIQTLYTPMVLPLSSPKKLGIIMSISALGIVFGSMFIGIFNINKNFTLVLAVSLAFAGLSFSLIGLTSSLLFITIFGFFFFSALPFVNTSADVLIRKNIANEKQGRAWGIIGVISQLGYVIAYSVAGILADRVFNPLLLQDGILAPTLGKLIGVGEGRGIGMLFIICGVFVVILAFITLKIKSIRVLENKKQY